MDIERVKELVEKATPGRWYCEEDEHTWQLFARVDVPLPDDADAALRELFPHGLPTHPMQLIKAAKQGTPYAEYWPDGDDAALMVAAPDLARLAIALSERLAAAEAREQKARAALAEIPQSEWIALWGISPSIARPLERAVETAFAALAPEVPSEC